MSQESDTPLVEMETYTKSVEREYTSVNGEEVPTAYAIDFLEELSVSEVSDEAAVDDLLEELYDQCS